MSTAARRRQYSGDTGLSRSPRTVLVIDDEPQIHPLVRKLCRSLDIVVESALTAVEGLAAATAGGPYEFILVDLRLPESSGLDVMRALRTAIPETPLVLATGYATVRDAVEAMTLGAIDVIEKPFSTDALGRVADRVRKIRALADARRPPASASAPVGDPSHLSRAEQWAAWVWRAGDLGHDPDPRTMHLWAHRAGTSVTALGDLCRWLDIQPRHARDLARIVRAIRESHRTGESLDGLLDCDLRTLAGLLHHAGIITGQPLPSVDDFLGHQDFVAPAHDGILALRRLAIA